MNIAIILGVSEYLDIQNNLPGCQTDVEYINKLLSGINKFDEIFILDTKTNSIEVKNQLSTFVSRYRDKQIDELFFYYTGHGEFFNNEFYYILSDFDKKKRKQTSLENSELDSLFRSLSPELIVKVVDACQAGITYVKGGDNSFEKYLNETGNSYKKCYFMFSSQSEQYSYQDDVSHFTQSFVNAVVNYKSNDIRYKDIIDYISDEFESNSVQTPFFVTQANFTEKFATLTDEITEFLSKLLTKQNSEIQENKDKTLPSLEQFVMQEAAIYCSESEMLNILEEIKGHIENYTFSTTLNSLFDFTIVSHKNLENRKLSEPLVPKLNLIGKWLNDNKHDYFAKPTIVTETYEEEVEDLSTLSSVAIGLGYNRPKKIVKKTRNVISGYTATYDYPHKVIKITMKPKYENLQWYNCSILVMTSKVNIRFFYFCSNYEETNWNYRTISNKFDWKTVEVKLKETDKIKDNLNKIMEEYTNYILNPLIERYNSSNSTQNKIQDDSKSTKAKTKETKEEIPVS